jgi:hypothetical protein
VKPAEAAVKLSQRTERREEEEEEEDGERGVGRSSLREAGPKKRRGAERTRKQGTPTKTSRNV